jgi:hypothetical protein
MLLCVRASQSALALTHAGLYTPMGHVRDLVYSLIAATTRAASLCFVECFPSSVSHNLACFSVCVPESVVEHAGDVVSALRSTHDLCDDVMLPVFACCGFDKEYGDTAVLDGICMHMAVIVAAAEAALLTCSQLCEPGDDRMRALRIAIACVCATALQRPCTCAPGSVDVSESSLIPAPSVSSEHDVLLSTASAFVQVWWLHARLFVAACRWCASHPDDACWAPSFSSAAAQCLIVEMLNEEAVVACPVTRLHARLKPEVGTATHQWFALHARICSCTEALL